MQVNSKRVRGCLFDVYPSDLGKVAVWIISENSERIMLTDEFQPKIYMSGKQKEIERLASSFSNQSIASWNFVHKYVQPTDSEKFCRLVFWILPRFLLLVTIEQAWNV